LFVSINEHIIFDKKIPYNDLPNLPISEEIIDKEILKKWGVASRIGLLSSKEDGREVFYINNDLLRILQR